MEPGLVETAWLGGTEGLLEYIRPNSLGSLQKPLIKFNSSGKLT